ncbi:hypothetical protein KXD40_003334 [Peronospora effusa]|uniref:Uncharacterized protein n=1 Tax=Peronospora effusa TaxID=542832 RepID=A0A3M6VIH3_9STRA|nr:hypothetical protein DD238_002365 [Peronospora effusa]RQM14467.1 hypothetical protein DD237_004309 [Peronospora effusa]UIZ29331.1 hypothetical protein KXD40_003334 [Peronospora effusa]
MLLQEDSIMIAIGDYDTVATVASKGYHFACRGAPVNNPFGGGDNVGIDLRLTQPAVATKY